MRVLFIFCIALSTAHAMDLEKGKASMPHIISFSAGTISPLLREPSLEDLSKVAITLHLNRYNMTISKELGRFLMQRLEVAANSPQQSRYIEELKEAWKKKLEGRSSPELETYLHDLVSESIEAAFKERDRKEKEHEASLELERWKYRRALLANVGTALGTATITALIAAVIK